MTENRVAVVTGAAQGIGHAIAESLAGQGIAVAIADLDGNKAGLAAQAIGDTGNTGASVIGVPMNVADPDSVRSGIDTVVAELGKPTILVNNAGGGGPKPFDMPMNDFRWAYELNVFSVFRLCQFAAPHMEKAGGGAVLNISSMSAENKNQRMASYGSSKAAVSHLTRNIAFDLGPKGIRVNGIAPGAIRTDALAKVLTPEVEQMMLKHTPLKRLGEPEDIASAALFLCAPAASWVSGQILTVSGGGVQELD